MTKKNSAVKDTAHVLFTDSRVEAWETAIVKGERATRSLLRFIQAIDKKEGLSSAEYYRAEQIKEGFWHMKPDGVTGLPFVDARRLATAKIKAGKKLSRADEKAVVANRIGAMESRDKRLADEASKANEPTKAGDKAKKEKKAKKEEKAGATLSMVAKQLSDLEQAIRSGKIGKKKLAKKCRAIRLSCSI